VCSRPAPGLDYREFARAGWRARGRLRGRRTLAHSDEAPAQRGTPVFRRALERLFNGRDSHLLAAPDLATAAAAKAAEDAARDAELKRKAEEEAARDREIKKQKEEAEKRLAEERKRLREEEMEKEAAEKRRRVERQSGDPDGSQRRAGDLPVSSAQNLDPELGLLVLRPRAGGDGEGAAGAGTHSLVIVSANSSNKKMKPHTILAAWWEGTRLTTKGGPDAFRYELTPTTPVFYKGSGERLTVQKCVAKHPECSSIAGYEKFTVVGSTPKVLKPKNAAVSMSLGWQRDDMEKSADLVLNTARGSASVKVLWQLKWSEKEKELQPLGVCIQTEKQMVIPGDGELALI